ncbi:pilus assembly protein CpaE [Vibrio navarrensis]|uniref:pilus assembly protein CpaE n=1 Tax=Vibrio navarrensis TaxID=29495 RepID=UPI001D222678|nr:pilus assembly protein CpaE [Vibrio navarrensis]MBE3651100.1 pilus assembly protein CpaE [Vibrio navarrensis]
MEIKRQSIMVFAQKGEQLNRIESVVGRIAQLDCQIYTQNMKAAIAQLSERHCADLLLLQVEHNDLQQLPALAKVTPPGCQVILFGDEISLSEYRHLVQMGIADYLALPLDPTALHKSLLHLLGVHSHKGFQHGQVYLLSGTSGGVGTSTIAANLALDLAKHRSVALVDFNLTFTQHPILLGVDYQPSLHRLVTEVERVDSVLIKQFGQNVGHQLSLFYAEDQEELSVQQRINVVNKLKQQFAYVILDVPHYLVEKVEDLLVSADNFLLVHDFSLQAGRRTDSILSKLDGNVHHVHLVGNQSRAKSHKPWSEKQLFEAWQITQFSELPFDSKAVQAAEQHGEPLIKRGGKLAKAMGKLKTRLAGMA